MKQEIHASITVACNECGEDIPENEVISTAGDWYCETCFNELFVILDNGNAVPIDDAISCDQCCNTFDSTTECFEHHNDEIYCESCAEENLVTDRNGNTLHRDDCTCCDGCGEYSEYDETLTDYLGNTVCEYCAENYVYCEDTEDYRHEEDAHYCEENGCYMSEESGSLLSYSANVLNHCGESGLVRGRRSPMYQNKALMFGVELETDTRGLYAHQIAEKLNLDNMAICKSDATCDGPELVTIPADLESHKNTVPWNEWCEVLRPIAKGHYGSDNGIHIHINLRAIRPLTLGKMLVFLNDEKNQSLLGMIAQRDYWNSEWCKRSTADKFRSVGKAGKSPHAGKYHIANVTENTVELRLFNSSLIPERILKNIEFCHALVRWCNQVSIKKINSQELRSFISANRKLYKNLHKFIESRSEA